MKFFWNFSEFFFHTRSVILFHLNFTAMGPKFRTFDYIEKKNFFGNFFEIFFHTRSVILFSPEFYRNGTKIQDLWKKKIFLEIFLNFFWIFFHTRSVILFHLKFTATITKFTGPHVIASREANDGVVLITCFFKSPRRPTCECFVNSDIFIICGKQKHPLKWGMFKTF